MKRFQIVMLCGLLATCAVTRCAHGALPTLSGLSDALTNLQSRYAQTTNALAETRARLDNATNALARCLAAFNSTMELRRALHGDFVSTFITNATERTIKRVDVYADGYEHTEKGHTQRYYTPEEMAERMAKRKPKKTFEERVADMTAEVARLEESVNSLTNEYERAKAVIALYGKQRSLERLKAQQTNTVTVVYGGVQ